MANPMQEKAFTSRYSYLSDKLVNRVRIYNPTDRAKCIEVDTLWDTGATNTCISHNVAKWLDLDHDGYITIQTPSGDKPYQMYGFNLILPNDVEIIKVRGPETEIGEQGVDLLIGMDIISKGDFAVSNYEGKTTFSFRIPSQRETSYADILAAKLKAGPKHGMGRR